MRRFRFQLIALALLLVAVVACGNDTSEKPDASGSMRIGLLLNFADSPETAAERERPSISQSSTSMKVVAYSASPWKVSPPMPPATPPLRSKRRSAWWRPRESTPSSVPAPARRRCLCRRPLPDPAGIPTISPSATSPQLTTSADNGYFFRTTLSDTAQGPALARLTQERGFDNVGIIYRDDPYGQG